MSEDGQREKRGYDFKDVSIALVNADTEQTPPVVEVTWKNAGQAIGLEIWRIVKTKVRKWPKEEYGSFYNCDSYIVLNTYKKVGMEELQHDLHFWIGKYATQEEYGTVAYKTVQLDRLLEDKAILHQEIMGHESDLFRSYFFAIALMEGGAEAGFRYVDPCNYEPRLLHFKGEKRIINLFERPMSKQSLDSDDVFILDLGLKLYQWNGLTSNKDERTKAVQYLSQLKLHRGKAKSETIEEQWISDNHPFMKKLPDIPVEAAENLEDEDDGTIPTMFRLQNSGGQVSFDKLQEGNPLDRSKLDSGSVYVIDVCKECFIWLGSGTDILERRNAFSYARKYLQKSAHPYIPVTVMKEGAIERKKFKKGMTAS